MIPQSFGPAPTVPGGPPLGGTAVVPPAAQYAELHRFTRQLTQPPRVDLVKKPTASAEIMEWRAQVLDPIYPTTMMWGYRINGDWGVPGPTLVARSNTNASVSWKNKLPAARNATILESHLLPVDEMGHLPMIDGALPSGIPIVTHLHGAHVDAAFDGGPEAWHTQFFEGGPEFFAGPYLYDNTQGSGTLWYHDHAVGITRLNVYAGLAGMYLLRDDNELAMIADGTLPSGRHEVELVIQDKDFGSDGQLFLPTGANGRLPSILTPFILVNGTPWPVFDVEPRPYRFRILNASDSRFYILKLRDTAETSTETDLFLQVGTDLGFRSSATPLSQILMGPAERYDVVVDFSDLAGRELILENHGLDGVLRGFTDRLPLNPATASNDTGLNPYSFGNPTAFTPRANPATTGQVMKFRVGTRLRATPKATVTGGTALGGGISTPPDTAPPRKVILFTGQDWLGRIMELQGNLEGGTFLYSDDVTETPTLDSVETWEIHNFTGLAHPVHIHLVHFEVLGRETLNPAFTSTPKMLMHHHGEEVTGAVVQLAADPFVPRPGTTTPGPRGPETAEVGPKDTVICYPNEVTRVRAHFDRPGSYVWHCHILHHEDHDMMRPFEVIAG